MDVNVNQYLEIFLEESKENLQLMNETLLKLESDTEDISLVNEIFRVAHTLKGMSGTMGFNSIAHFTHEMENILDFIRSGKVVITSDLIDCLFESLDMLEGFVNNIIESGSEGADDTAQLLVKLKKVINFGEVIPEVKLEITPEVKADDIAITVDDMVKNVIQQAVTEGYNAFKVKVQLNADCMLKAARAFIVFNTVEEDGDIIKSEPKVEDLEAENFKDILELITLTTNTAQEVITKLKNISDVVDVFVEAVAIEEEESTLVIKQNEKIDKVDIPAVKAEKEIALPKGKAKVAKTVKVDVDRLDSLMNLVSELIITRSRITAMDETMQKKEMDVSLEYLATITSNLHDAVMKVRMVAIERVFNRFPRMVRDVSKSLGKEINLVMSGEETEVDRNVIDEIGEPLIHLLRNSIDHGIESSKERIANGKPEVGTVKLAAYPDGNSVVIEVEDDGGGINIEKVKGIALAKGLITQEQFAVMDDKEAVMLLFKAGFSTADKVSDISGRGVGLDVVKTKIETLGGVVEVETVKSKGSKFIIRLPLTLALIQALLVNVGHEKYAIALNTIQEIITIKAKNIRRVQNQEVVVYSGKTIPLVRLATVLKTEVENNNLSDLQVVVVKKGDLLAGLIVDGLIGQQEIVLKSLGQFLDGNKYISGATILGDGQVALIVDTHKLI